MSRATPRWASSTCHRHSQGADTTARKAASAGRKAALRSLWIAARGGAGRQEGTVSFRVGRGPGSGPIGDFPVSSGGHIAALALLALASLATAASLVLAPPITPAAAVRRIAIGLAALFLLSPATRFGHFIYPIALFWWAALAEPRHPRAVADVPLPGLALADGSPVPAEACWKDGQHAVDLV